MEYSDIFVDFRNVYRAERNKDETPSVVQISRINEDVTGSAPVSINFCHATKSVDVKSYGWISVEAALDWGNKSLSIKPNQDA